MDNNLELIKDALAEAYNSGIHHDKVSIDTRSKMLLKRLSFDFQIVFPTDKLVNTETISTNCLQIKTKAYIK